MQGNPPETRATEAATQSVTRLAPSPTGALHLGNARTFLVNWAIARQRAWKIILRIEDLDGPRVKPGSDRQSIALLQWLGIDFDQGPLWQSPRLAEYQQTMHHLVQRGMAYRSDLSRAEVERQAADIQPIAPSHSSASAPQEGSHEVRFPPELRPTIDDASRARGFDDPNATWRFVVKPGTISFTDRFAGPQSFDVSAIAGDFIVWTRQGVPAYQLAVVLDDASQGITEVVRGDDLLDSAARQILIYDALGLKPRPAYTHLPLVKGTDGRRLAKRHGDTRLDTYRDAGIRPERIIGLVAFWCGTIPARREISSAEFQQALSLDTIPKAPVVFTPEDDAWLRART